jgi:dienelactone hydrolase
VQRKLTLQRVALTVSILFGVASFAAAQPAASPLPASPASAKPMWDLARLSQSPAVYPAEGFKADGIQGLFFEGVPYHGRPTRVFAWMGIPAVPPGQKLPGMVLVHGGGGTAFDTWVRLWNQRGYAAIAMDTCGCVPTGTYGKWKRHDAGGPAGWGGFDQIDQPREDQWTYHAVAAAILGHSLLRAQKEVDPERTGLTGISWGGYLTSLIAGVDPRFKLAAPVYGCGFTTDHTFAKSVTDLGPERGPRWMRWWDPSSYLNQAAMPILWVNGSNDFAYTLGAYQKSYRLPQGPRTLCIRLRMPHGHGPAGEAPKEIQVFADSILKGGEPLAKITGQGRDGRKVWATYESPRPIKYAELNVTRDLGLWPNRKWDAVRIPVGGNPAGRVTGTLPEGATVYYINLFDDRDCAVSTEHEELATK